MRYVRRSFAIAAFTVFIMGCQNPAGLSAVPGLAPATSSGDGSHLAPPTSRAPSSATPTCSALNFSGVQWPASMDSSAEWEFGLALEISGSYEGDGGWANLTNNFDGQGLSMGLLNQTLGTGSLQPLLAEMRDRHLDVMKSIFQSAHLQSLLNMLAQWQNAGGVVASFQMRRPLPSLLDVVDPRAIFSAQMLSATTSSVAWAVANLYNGTEFNPTWEDELTKLAQTPEYVSLQIGAAADYEQMSIQYMQDFGVQQLRSFLFMFDVVVQDGGFSGADISTYKANATANAKLSETARLNKILTMRLARVKSQFQTDVKSRKAAIINGSGTVHGAKRNLETEYCYSGKTKYIY